MAFGLVGKLRRCLAISAFIWLALPAWSRAQSCATCNTGAQCGQQPGCLAMLHCPHHFRYYQEGPPRLCFKCACPHPVCNPCTLPHFGYFETCWSPYPFPSDWSHCPTTPPAAYVNLNPFYNPNQTVYANQGTPPANHQPGATFQQPVPANQPLSPGAYPRGSDLPQPRQLDGMRPGS